jgi:hypothetical protein
MFPRLSGLEVSVSVRGEGDDDVGDLLELVTV